MWSRTFIWKYVDKLVVRFEILNCYIDKLDKFTTTHCIVLNFSEIALKRSLDVRLRDFKRRPYFIGVITEDEKKEEHRSIRPYRRKY